jgi:hypothetical protein
VRRLRLFLALIAIATVGCQGSHANKAGGQEQKQLVLTLANANPGDVDVGEWVQAVERLSHGSIRIEIKSEWRQDELDGRRRRSAMSEPGASISPKFRRALGAPSACPISTRSWRRSS